MRAVIVLIFKLHLAKGVLVVQFRRNLCKVIDMNVTSYLSQVTKQTKPCMLMSVLSEKVKRFI